jgi:hypothetical protein
MVRRYTRCGFALGLYFLLDCFVVHG